MLLPFEFAILTVEEAKLLKKFIEESTATKAFPKNYMKMGSAGVLELYRKLEEFLHDRQQWNDRLRYFDPNDFAPADRDYDD